ncbi:hypothetical protein BLL52_3468 [Rhodoferax antarcticus ANT.BR]|uniref:Uncharacterized protein n=1 Tax=Rhodoferax antarcticus ANT.BR TaxID=1111071 RepID=A0A1Q8YBH4_9BURK|nr:hypothetical protein BLL52_3468 [Rhodoferax antarcticus ANT.BR]
MRTDKKSTLFFDDISNAVHAILQSFLKVMCHAKNRYGQFN